MTYSTRMRSVLAALVLTCAAACGGGTLSSAPSAVGGPPAPDLVPVPDGGASDAPVEEGTGGDSLRGGVLATFDVGGARFRVWVTNGQAAGLLSWISIGLRPFVSIAGPIAEGPGRADHNTPWAWHMEPAGVYVNLPTAAADQYVGTLVEVEVDRADIIRRGLHVVLTSEDAQLVSLEDYRDPVPDPGSGVDPPVR